MEKTPKIIPTDYQGTRYRSRTEARWAVFFESAGIRFEYEREGYDLEGEWYLPDFWLPDCEMWLEVKGDKPTEGELRNAIKLANASGRLTVIAVGPPSADNPMMFCGPESAGLGTVGDSCLFMGDRRDEGCVWLSEKEFMWGRALFGSKTDHDRYPDPDFAPTGNAYRTAKNERFEEKRRG